MQYVVVQQEPPYQVQTKTNNGGYNNGYQPTQQSSRDKDQAAQLLGQSYSAQIMSQLKNSSDKSVFMRHGDIEANVSIDIKHIRDRNNVLGLMDPAEHEDYLFAINEDTLGQICKFHNIPKRDALKKLESSVMSPQKFAKKQVSSRINAADIPAIEQLSAQEKPLNIFFQYFIIIELSLNSKVFEPTFYSGIHNTFEVGEKIIFPIRYCDLATVSLIGITIYDMKKPYAESLLAGTTIDIFDEKFRLRQGVFNLYLWPKVKADISLNSKSPGLFDHEALKEINVLLNKIDLNAKNHGSQSSQDPKGWLDKLSREAIYSKLFELYIENNDAFLEIGLPEFGYTAIYSDNMNQALKNQYIFPQNIQMKFNKTSSTVNPSESLF